MKFLKELTEAKYYLSSVNTQTPGRVINPIVRKILNKYGYNVMHAYNDAYPSRGYRRLSYVITANPGVRYIPSNEIENLILGNIEIELRGTRFFNSQVYLSTRIQLRLGVRIPLENQ